MSDRPCIHVVLAAGEGTRMRSKLPKVMHAIAGEPMLGHVLAALGSSGGGTDCAVVVGPGMEQVARFAVAQRPDASVHVQSERLGTAHAVLSARGAISPDRDVIVLYGDTPLVQPETLDSLRGAIGDGADLAVLAFEAANPAGYGRLIVEGDRLLAIREDRDASPEEKEISLCNSGVIAFRSGLAIDLLDAIGNDNAKGEYYLTDAVEIAVARGLSAVAVKCPEAEVQGVNTRAQLAAAEAALQARLRRRAMDGGATLVAPETVFLSSDTVLGRDVVVEPNVFFGPGVTIGDDVAIRAFSHIEGATISDGATVGPYARLRPGAGIGEGARIGNFVEVKAAAVEAGAKVNHLSYIGDARVGAGANIGAGTITCNYDGTAKHHTDIGAGAFIGSNSALVAPVRIGDRAYVGSGSVITSDVAADALAIARARQVDVPDWTPRRVPRRKPD
ncbi:bifunctional UDP-N-acetylglucosamine diphosphorylase/glucosamine-1-phosphate N-acetyltransferase GlmU [Microbaculum marinum]|uniref:Bifunctional protein GlmU n=1 Tax=Microbaculum marinum TaxID=1764581 RepID=A0AAW9RSS2_9HYPH